MSLHYCANSAVTTYLWDHKHNFHHICGYISIEHMCVYVVTNTGVEGLEDEFRLLRELGCDDIELWDHNQIQQHGKDSSFVSFSVDVHLLRTVDNVHKRLNVHSEVFFPLQS